MVLRAFLLLAPLLLAVDASAGEILIDEFDDDVLITTSPLVTTNVGSLNATRTIKIGAGSLPPPPLPDVAIANSQLLFDIPSTEEWSLEFRYDFASPVDFGTNNAILLDISSIETEDDLVKIFVILAIAADNPRGYTSGRLNDDFNPQTHVDPVTVDLRGFNDLSQVDHFSLALFGFRQDFQIGLDRIRIGRIPEPTSLILALLVEPFCLVRQRVLPCG